MIVLRAAEVPTRVSDAESRAYYMQEGLELIVTRIPAGHVQPWHRHERILETTYVLEGAVRCREGVESFDLGVGDMVTFSPSTLYHTMENATDRVAVTLTIKNLAHPQSSHDVFAKDKITESTNP